MTAPGWRQSRATGLDQLEASRGVYGGLLAVSKFGRNGDIDLAAAEDVWTVGGERAWLSAASALEAVSSSATDTAAGDDARVIMVEGLDENFAYATEAITLNGASASSATSTTFIRVNRVYVTQVGTYGGTNAGTITVRLESAGATQAQIAAGNGQTEQTHYSVAADKTAYMIRHYVNTDSSKSISPTLWQRPGIDSVSAPFVHAKRKLWGATGVAGSSEHIYASYPSVAGPADIWWGCAVSANNTEVEAGYDLYVVDD